VVMGLAYIGNPTLFFWGLIMTAGYVLAIPFGVWLSNPTFGNRMAKTRICGIPEEFETPAEINAVQGKTV
jgi:membrane glycosyltransferase